MKLPQPLYDALAHHFGTHRCWHVARFDAQFDLRKLFPGECGPELHPLSDPRSGCDFLLHHRRMIRHFKWTIANGGIAYDYQPWPGRTLPSWVEELLTKKGFDVAATYQTLDELIASGSVEALGSFIEPNASVADQPGLGVHNKIHRVIDAFEKSQGLPVSGAEMGDMATAPGNVHFWDLHGWIDGLYAEWQTGHGESPELEPTPMKDPMVSCDPTLPSMPP